MSHSNSFFSASLAESDPEISKAVELELGRQRKEIELIASENIVSRAVLEAQGSVLTNKYAEGYPGKRYYGGCQFVDIAENLAIERVTQLFGCRFANVQPNSGSQANQAVFLALLQPGDTFMGLDLAAGGHLTHGSPVNMSGKWFKPVSYGVNRETGRIDMDEVAKLAQEHKPKLIIAGGSAYARFWDFAKFREIADERGRLSVRRHGAFRRPCRGRRASLAVPARPCRDLDDAQDPARPARRPHPHRRRGDRQEDQFGHLPRPAGRPADACDRRQGGRLRRGAAARVQGLRAAGGRQCQGAGRRPAQGRLRPRHRRHRQPSDAGRPAAEEADRQGGGSCARVARTSPATRTACRSIRKSRGSPRAFASARPPRPRAASVSTSSSRSAT